jgi:hypothetical protein
MKNLPLLLLLMYREKTSLAARNPPTAQDSNANIANYHRKEKTTRNKPKLNPHNQ